jgi:hypothetical protein
MASNGASPAGGAEGGSGGAPCSRRPRLRGPAGTIGAPQSPPSAPPAGRQAKEGACRTQQLLASPDLHQDHAWNALI